MFDLTHLGGAKSQSALRSKDKSHPSTNQDPQGEYSNFAVGRLGWGWPILGCILYVHCILLHFKFTSR